MLGLFTEKRSVRTFILLGSGTVYPLSQALEMTYFSSLSLPSWDLYSRSSPWLCSRQ